MESHGTALILITTQSRVLHSPCFPHSPGPPQHLYRAWNRMVAAYLTPLLQYLLFSKQPIDLCKMKIWFLSCSAGSPSINSLPDGYNLSSPIWCTKALQIWSSLVSSSSTQFPNLMGKCIFIFYIPYAWSYSTLYPLRNQKWSWNILFYSALEHTVPLALNIYLQWPPNLLSSSPSF